MIRNTMFIKNTRENMWSQRIIQYEVLSARKYKSLTGTTQSVNHLLMRMHRSMAQMCSLLEATKSQKLRLPKTKGKDPGRTQRKILLGHLDQQNRNKGTQKTKWKRRCPTSIWFNAIRKTSWEQCWNMKNNSLKHKGKISLVNQCV